MGIPGIVSPPFNTELCKAKLDTYLLREVALFNRKRFEAQELFDHGVVDVVAPADELLPKALELALCLWRRSRGSFDATFPGSRMLYSSHDGSCFSRRAVHVELLLLPSNTSLYYRPSWPTTTKSSDDGSFLD